MAHWRRWSEMELVGWTLLILAKGLSSLSLVLKADRG
jgi:hypothetical protein